MVSTPLNRRLADLEEHLQHENPILVEVVRDFREIDRIAHRMGLLDGDESYATRISWWPLVSILGTFSAGKSSFVNHYLGRELQRTGNQAVDDRFTVLCYSDDAEVRLLPGVALDADPRFPFFQISQDIEQVAAGEGRRIDSYLQLKTCDSPELRGKILIDSPGFDADAQRTSTLRIIDQVVDLSDLVLVFFDARHPEPGAMRDTLKHLVADTIKRADAGKFLYVLNQLDTTAREDNPEEVVAAWQRALAEKGLTAGRFYCIYNPDAAVEIPDPERRGRYEAKRDRDLHEILSRIRQVEVSRGYRIVGLLEKTAQIVTHDLVPKLTAALERWRRRTLVFDAIAFGLLLIVAAAIGYQRDWTNESPSWWTSLRETPWLLWTVVAVAAVGAFWLHQQLRRLAARMIGNQLSTELVDTTRSGDALRAFRTSTRWWRPLWSTRPAGWNRRAEERLGHAAARTSHYVQALNDHFTQPAGNDSASNTSPTDPRPLDDTSESATP